MTKVELTYPLTKPLDEDLLRRVGGVHAIYGINRIEVDPDLKWLRVGYDASRLTPKEVEGALRRAGIPIAATHS